MTSPTKCVHAHTRLIAEDEHEKYVECLDCGAILGHEERPAAGRLINEAKASLQALLDQAQRHISETPT